MFFCDDRLKQIGRYSCQALIAVFLLVLSAFLPAAAQIAIEPDMMTVHLEAGKERAAYFTIRNPSYTVKHYHFDVEYRRQGNCPLELKKWIQVNPISVEILPNQEAQVQLAFKGLQNHKTGECIVALFVTERKNSKIILDVRYGIPIYVLWNKKNKVRGKITQVNSSVVGRDLTLEMKVKNTGQTHLAPYGFLWVDQKGGERLWQSEFRTDQLIFPGETKTISWTGRGTGTLPADGNVSLQVFWGTMYDIAVVGPPKSEIRQFSLMRKHENGQ